MTAAAVAAGPTGDWGEQHCCQTSPMHGRAAERRRGPAEGSVCTRACTRGGDYCDGDRLTDCLSLSLSLFSGGQARAGRLETSQSINPPRARLKRLPISRPTGLQKTGSRHDVGELQAAAHAGGCAGLHHVLRLLRRVRGAGVSGVRAHLLPRLPDAHLFARRVLPVLSPPAARRHGCLRASQERRPRGGGGGGARALPLALPQGRR